MLKKNTFVWFVLPCDPIPAPGLCPVYDTVFSHVL